MCEGYALLILLKHRGLSILMSCPDCRRRCLPGSLRVDPGLATPTEIGHNDIRYPGPVSAPWRASFPLAFLSVRVRQGLTEAWKIPPFM
jgi:hypothetical protein